MQNSSHTDWGLPGDGQAKVNNTEEQRSSKKERIAERKRSIAALKERLAHPPMEPGWAAAAEQERRQPRSVWADPDRYRGQPKAAAMAVKPLTARAQAQAVATSESIPAGDACQPQALLLKAPEVCRLLGGVSLRTLSRMEKKGLLRSVHLLRHKLYARQDVEALVENLRKWKP